MKSFQLLIAACLLVVLNAAAEDPPMVVTTNVVTFTVSGTWVGPENVTNVQVECWGGGGAGGSAWRTPNTSSTQYGGGGAGGAYAKLNSYPVTPGSNYYINVGAGGVAATGTLTNDFRVAGGNSWFNSVNSEPSGAGNCVAKGGEGGECAVGNTSATAFGVGGTGTTTGSLGDTVYAGGSGGTQTSSSNGYGGSGGGSGGTGTAGNSGSTNGIGATAVPGGGPGGNANATQGSSGPGQSPTSGPGGGGGGARATDPQRAGGNGFSGQVILIYTVGASPSSNVSATAAAPTGNGSGPGGLTAYAQRTRITLTETPSAGTPPFTYSWKKVGSGTVLGTSSNLVVSPPVNGDQYYCDVTATWDNVISTSPTSTLTVTTVIDSNKVAIIKADDFRASNWSSQAWTNFLVASRDLGVKVSPGVVVTNIGGNASIAQWMQEQEAIGDVEFWNHGWDHTQWLDGGTNVYEFKGSGLAFQQKHLVDSQAGLSNALGHEVIAFGTPYNQYDTITTTLINDTSALKLFFASSVSAVRSAGLDARVAAVKIINEADPYGDGTGMPNAEKFKAQFPSGPAGPVSLQFHPADANFDMNRVAQYQQIVQHLLANGYAFLLPSEYVASLPAAASFSATPTYGGAPLTVTFTDTSLGTPTNRFWSFGDGATVSTTLTSLQHNYRFPGTNTVRLIVSDASGSSTNTKANLIVAASEDTVGDGVPDWWRAQYFGGDGTTTNADSAATADYDKDGRSNMEEYLSDTNPTNAASRLAIISLIMETSNAHLTWVGGSNAWQYLEASSTLNSNDWTAIYTNTPPTPITNNVSETGAASTSNRFYRVKATR